MDALENARKEVPKNGHLDFYEWAVYDKSALETLKLPQNWSGMSLARTDHQTTTSCCNCHSISWTWYVGTTYIETIERS